MDLSKDRADPPSAQPSMRPVAALTVLERAGRFILDSFLPPQCLGCRTLLRGDVALCPACWSKIRFIASPQCGACGLPFSAQAGGADTDDAVLCGECLVRPRLFERARAAMVYNDGSRGLILAFKRGDRTDAAPAFGQWMARAGHELLADAHLLVPVPLHWTRLFARKYNQAALLALALQRASGVAAVPDLLIRHRRTASLGHLGATARAETVRGAIAVRANRAPAIRGRRVVLIDDVHTTGATAAACTRALLSEGAAAVDVLTLARTVREL